MRQVKFRAWDSKFKEMHTSSFSGNYITFGGLIRNGSIQKDWILSQFTGLKDKNGKGIYEGDVLSFEAKICNGFVHNRTVTLSPVEFGKFHASEPSTCNEYVGFHIDGMSIQCYLDYGAVVIGNIYENPELLNQS